MAIDICIRLGRRIRALRDAHGWNQAYLAEVSGLGKIYISQLENGRKQACIRSIETLALSFEMSVSEFLKGV
ncbi:helix-turn-helix domain-containing protein [Granulicella aggregans]|uniref:helix-turn-helix domain-containing protein n=1 Tax=Granulicella aggregans TaxID=474949 RepID=UPI0021DFB56C|nr:helix-turn-helix transcriptional regulator [Granulicella aggregans]